jgi:uncharacterized cupin superfamily protein
MTRTNTRAPLRIDPGVLVDRLEEMPPLPARPEGKHGHVLSERDGGQRASIVYEGDIVTQIFESGPRKLQLVDTPYDEFIHVLDGKLILTDDKGVAHEFGPGDNLLLPRGFTGTWEMIGDTFRELIVVEGRTWHEMRRRSSFWAGMKPVPS